MIKLGCFNGQEYCCNGQSLAVLPQVLLHSLGDLHGLAPVRHHTNTWCNKDLKQDMEIATVDMYSRAVLLLEL